VLVAIAMAIFLGTIDGSIVNVALPTLVDEFDTTFAVSQWVVLAYLLTQATLTLGFGRLGDMMGKKPIFTTGFVVFTVGSVLAGLSPTIGWLIAARVVQAVGAAMIFALGFAITTEAFPPTERGRALGINGTMVSLGIMAGPIVGGLIIEATDWRWIFFVNLRSVKEIPKFGMRTLAYHEAIPGHHFQIASAQEIEGVPFFRRIIPFTSYTEGWALYAEQLAAENGFQEDPYDRLGYLTAQVFRAVRLVVDTGIHRKRDQPKPRIGQKRRACIRDQCNALTLAKLLHQLRSPLFLVVFLERQQVFVQAVPGHQDASPARIFDSDHINRGQNIQRAQCYVFKIADGCRHHE